MARARTYAVVAGVIAAIALTVMAFAAFASLSGSPAGPKSTLRIAVVTDALFSDEGWGESALNAAKFIESKYGFEVATEDDVSIADIESTLKKYAQSGYQLIIAHGVQWGDPALRVGEQYPNVRIVVFTGLVDSENVASIFPQQQQGSFLLGALAGMMTETNIIGYVGGEEYPNIVNIFEGYKQGGKAVNPDVKIVGTYLNDWDNPAKGKEATTSIIRQNADVIFHVADSSGQGVILASSNVETLRSMNEGFTDALSGNSGIRDIALNEEKATFVFKPIILEGKQFGVLYIVTPHAYASDVAGLIDQQMNFSLMLTVITGAAAIGVILIILTWNRRLEQTVNTRTAELLVANEQLKTQDKMQREFINIAAHELRTPIQPILVVAEMLEQELREKKEDIRMIARNARRLERLTRDLLDVAKIDGQTPRLYKEKFDISELVSTLVQDYRKGLATGHDVLLEYESKESIIVEADKERITQVISNLLDNAFKFTKSGRVVINAKKSNARATISVQDSGTGIEPDIIPRLFTKFVSKSQSGTGLGLFISKSIVEAHGGEIWGENNEGKGANFTFTIP